MQRLTPDNPRVVWESEPSREIFNEASWDEHGTDRVCVSVCDELWIADAHNLPLRTRIRITAEVIPPSEVER